MYDEFKDPEDPAPITPPAPAPSVWSAPDWSVPVEPKKKAKLKCNTTAEEKDKIKKKLNKAKNSTDKTL